MQKNSDLNDTKEAFSGRSICKPLGCMAGQECALDIEKFICAAFKIGKRIVIIELCINNTVTQIWDMSEEEN